MFIFNSIADDIFPLISCVGAIHCNILAIRTGNDFAAIKLQVIKLIYLMIWHSLVIISPVVTLAFFPASLKQGSLHFLLIIYFVLLLTPWLEFSKSGTHLPSNTKIIPAWWVSMDAYLNHASICCHQFSCLSAVKLQLSNEELIRDTRWDIQSYTTDFSF
uniref:Testis-specific XK-related protein, Y-linked n=1 Tax=Homo sapiens TaxID=9606 RepID=XKRY_HUMAN|nr:RecName: Full=Testis-specific XK-related protein, Y-linked [Homo sapiens]AAC51844.1 testis-specific XK Related Y [Homo sapiens]